MDKAAENSLFIEKNANDDAKTIKEKFQYIKSCWKNANNELKTIIKD